MANIVTANARYVSFIIRDNHLNTGELNITKIFIHEAGVGEPYVDNVATLVNSEELVVSTFKTSETALAIHAEKSLQNPFQYNRCYLTNSSNEIIYIFDIAVELQSEIDIDFLIKLEDVVNIVS